MLNLARSVLLGKCLIELIKYLEGFFFSEGMPIRPDQGRKSYVRNTVQTAGMLIPCRSANQLEARVNVALRAEPLTQNSLLQSYHVPSLFIHSDTQ